MSDELEKQIDPFTVRDALILHDKRLHQLTDQNFETQKIVQKFEESMKTLLDRINEGVSPKQNIILDKQIDAEKHLLIFESKIDLKFSEVEKHLSLQQLHYDDKFVEVDRWMNGLRGLMWKL